MKTKTIKQKSLLDYYNFSKVEQKKYPVVTGILKQLTPERIEKEINEIQKVKLPLELQRWMEEYEKVGERDEFIWKWLYKMFQVVSPFSVIKKYQKSLWSVKVLVTMFIVQLDDIADKQKNEILLDKLLKISLKQNHIDFNYLNKKEKRYLIYTKNLWNYIEQKIKKYPKYKKLKKIFYFDTVQVLNTIKYSHFLNNYPYLINKTECDLYMPYNMVAMIYSELDLMCLSNIDFRKFGKIREIILLAQKMARIGNWISTWEREIYEDDFSSGVFIYAIDLGITTIDEMNKKNKLKIIKKIKNTKIEKNFLKEWERYYYEIEKLGTGIKAIYIKKFLSGLEKLIVLHLISKKYK